MAGRAKTNIWLQYLLNFIAFCGLCLSIYGLLVEIYLDADSSYEPMCDVNEYVSCSKAFMSDWGKGMGLVGPLLGENHWLNQPNVVYGIATYCFLFFLAMLNSISAANLYLWITILMNVCSIYLASVLYRLRIVCVVCVATYVVNLGLLFAAAYRRSLLIKMLRKKQN